MRQTGLSVAVIDRDTRAVVGANYRFVMSQGSEGTHNPTVRPAHVLLENLDNPVKRRLLADEENIGSLMFCSSLFVDVRLSSTDHASISYALEANALDMARRRGFKGVVSTNSHPVTKVYFHTSCSCLVVALTVKRNAHDRKNLLRVSSFIRVWPVRPWV